MREDLLDILSVFLAFIVFLIIKPYANVWATQFISKVRLATRIKKVGVQSEKNEDGVEDLDDESIGLSKKGPTFGDNALFNFIAEKNPEYIENMKQLLIKAGRRDDADLEEFMKSKLISGLSLFMIFFLLTWTNDFDMPLWGAALGGIVVGVIGGDRLTDLNMEFESNRRKEEIDRGVPDLVDLLVICAESGLDLNSSIRRVAREMRTSNPTLADELSLTAIEMEMIPDHKQVFTNLENRTDCLEIKTISKTLSQSIEYGSSLGASLKDIAIESRQKRMLLAEEKAAKAPTLLTLPMMFFVMPCLFIVMLGPVIIGMINSFSAK